MPKKIFASEPAVIFDQLVESAVLEDEHFTLKTTNPAYQEFAPALIDEHFPAQNQLPLD